MSNILITGANGQLGSEIHALSASYPQHHFTFVERSAFDLGNLCKMEDFFETHAFDALINCGAYTAVDKAQSDEAMANTLNHRSVSLLAKIAKKQKMTFIHISTDYVFDGKNHRPYLETDPTDPQGVYGKTKRDGENAILAVNAPNTVIIRTSWVYSSFGNNFVKTMLRLGGERESLGVIFDQVGTPTYARDLAQVILDILPTITNTSPEIYHYSNEGAASWYDFAQAIFELSSIHCTVNPITTDQYPTPAVRPHYSLLDKTKIKNDFGITIPYWRESLKHCLAKINEAQDNHFDIWNTAKKKIAKKGDILGFNEQDILFVSIGQNIGYETFGKGDDFLRPVIVMKKFGKYSFLGIPLSSKIKEGEFFYKVQFKNRENTALLNQIKTFDTRRVKYKLGYLGKTQFEELKKIVAEKLTPLARGGARVGENHHNCTLNPSNCQEDAKP